MSQAPDIIENLPPQAAPALHEIAVGMDDIGPGADRGGLQIGFDRQGEVRRSADYEMRLNRQGSQQFEQPGPINDPRGAADSDDQTRPDRYLPGIALCETR